jgi:hypothetical protein
MDDAERAFRDALHRVDSVKIPVPSLQPADVRRAPGLGIMMGRWLAAAAVLAMVAGLAVWALAGRGQVVAGVPAQGASPAGRVMLTGATWVALEFYGKPAARTNGAVPYLSFETDSTFFGGDACEQSTAPTTIDTTEPLGSYRLMGNDLQVTLDPAKAIGCDPAERELIRTVLDSTRRVYRDGDTLELLDQPGNVLARFRATAGHPAATNGTDPSPTPTSTNMPTQVPEITPSIGPAPVIGVRIRNKSSVDFSDVYAVFPNGTKVHYGPVPAGGVSKYESVLEAYSYSYLKVKAGGHTYVYQPVDYVGESVLPNGKYSYALDLVGSRIDLTLERD